MNLKLVLVCFSLILLLIDRHLVFIESLYLRLFAIFLIFTASILDNFQISRRSFLLVFIGTLILFLTPFSQDVNFIEMIHSLIIIIALPICLNAAPYDKENFNKFVCFTIFSLCCIGLLAGYNFSDPSLGDSFRSARLTLGFDKPSTLSMVSFVFWLAFFNIKLNTNLNIFLKTLVFFLVITVQILSGSRAGLGCMLVSCFLIWEQSEFTKARSFIKWFARITFVSLFIVLISDLNVDRFNTLSSGRLFIWFEEISQNLTSFSSFIFGNLNPVKVFNYFAETDSIIYHIDSFFVERFIVSGLIGLMILIFLIKDFKKHINGLGNCFIYGLIFYAFWETDVFNLTSFTSLAPLLLIATNYREQKKLQS